MKFLSFRKRITSITVLRVTFKTDHNLMTTNNSDWTNSGSTFAKPDWTSGNPSNPISHEQNKKAAVQVDLQVSPPNAEVTDGDLTGTFSAGQFKPIFPPVKFQGGPVSVSVQMTAPLPNQVEKLTDDIRWSVSTTEDGPFEAGSSLSHTIYLTMGTPVNAPTREAGITLKRMDRSVALVGAAGSADPQAIAKYITGQFPGYTLKPDPAVPAQFHHPWYMAMQGESESGCGAWPAADYFSQEAECQAIIRFTRAVMLQVGCPGDMSIVVVWADPNNNATVMEGDWDAGSGGLDGVTKVVKGKTWSATLADNTSPVKVGQLFDPDDLGLNNYEACLKLTYGGTTMYYGGGAGDYPTKEQVITCFQALCWISIVNLKNGNQKVRIEQIVKRY